MKTRLITALMLAVAIGIFGSVNGALATSIVWQIGQPDGSVAPDPAYTGALEYPAPDTNNFIDPSFLYIVDPMNPIDLMPYSPGYLGGANPAGIVGDGRPSTLTTPLLEISFTLDVAYFDLALAYDRYGSESDVVKLDSNDIDTLPVNGEGKFQQFIFDLDYLPAGDHTITIDYGAGGSDNGHYLDYVQLTGEPVPEPATMLLLGTGLVGLAGFRRKFKK